MEKGYHFFALLHRMKYIDRWSLMRNTQKENLSEHTLDVCFITHALVTINHLDFKGDADLEKALLLALYHDVPEILTGDLPTPVKYYNEKIKSSYDEIEAFAAQRLLSHLPEDFREKYAPWFEGLPCYEQKLVKAADKLSALCKCITELRTRKPGVCPVLSLLPGLFRGDGVTGSNPVPGGIYPQLFPLSG